MRVHPRKPRYAPPSTQQHQGLLTGHHSVCGTGTAKRLDFFYSSSRSSSLISQRRQVPFPRVELFELPRAAADGAALLRLRVEPLGDAL